MNKAIIFGLVAAVLVGAIAAFGLHQRKKMAAIEAVGAGVVVGAVGFVATRGKA